MHILFILLILISSIYASSDYFDILEKELYQKLDGKVRKFYITAEESIWDYASECDSKENVPSKEIIVSYFNKPIIN